MNLPAWILPATNSTMEQPTSRQTMKTAGFKALPSSWPPLPEPVALDLCSTDCEMMA